MTTANIPVMRPMRLPELLDQAIRLYRRNFFSLIAIVGIPLIPLAALQTWAQYLSSQAQNQALNSSFARNPFASSDYLIALGISFLVGVVQAILLYGWAASAMTQIIGGDISNQPITLSSALRQGFSWLRLAGVRLLVGFALFIWILVPCLGWATGPGMLMAFGMMVFPLMPAVFVFENPDALQIFRRAWDLARSRFWWMIGFGLALALMAQFLVTGPAVLAAGLVAALANSSFDLQQQLLLTSITQSLITTFSTMLYLPLQICAAAVVYFDLRVRAEALDLALQAAREADPAASIVSLARTSPPAQATFITGQEFLYFFLLGLGVVALYFLLVGTLFAVFAAALGSGGF